MKNSPLTCIGLLDLQLLPAIVMSSARSGAARCTWYEGSKEPFTYYITQKGKGEGGQFVIYSLYWGRGDVGMRYITNVLNVNK